MANEKDIELDSIKVEAVGDDATVEEPNPVDGAEVEGKEESASVEDDLTPMTYFKKAIRFKRPSKKKTIRLLGWYMTRAVVGLLWCCVVWAFIGRDALPKYGSSDDYSPCISQYNLSDVLLTEILDSLLLPQNTEGDVGNYSYLYACSSSADDEYCLVTLNHALDCVNKVNFNVSLLSDNFSQIMNQNYSTSDYNFTFDLSKEIDKANAKTTYSLFDIPEGHFFALMVLVIAASLGGMLAGLLRLPPLLGMMIAGFLLRNLPVIGIAGDISYIWSSTLRYTVLVIILIRGGMALEVKQLWSLKLTLTALALLPGIVEAAVAGIVAIFLLDMPWQWGLLLGSLLSSISPSVVVPTTLHLSDNVEGIHEGIATLIIAAANIDVVIAISLFSFFLGLIFSTSHVALDIFRGPIEIVVGLVYGIICGLSLWYIPTKHHSDISKARNRFFLLFGFGLLAMFGSRQIVIQGASLSGAGPLGVLCVAFIGVQKWDPVEKHDILRTFYILWLFCKPVLFGLIGAALNLDGISGSLVGKAVALLAIAVVVRLIVSVLSVSGHNFNIREKVFVAIAWLPKATVQAAIGSVALDQALSNGTEEQQRLGQEVLTISVLSIVFTAPLGATLMGVLGPWLLGKNETDLDDDDASSISSGSSSSSYSSSSGSGSGSDSDREIDEANETGDVISSDDIVDVNKEEKLIEGQEGIQVDELDEEPKYHHHHHHHHGHHGHHHHGHHGHHHHGHHGHHGHNGHNGHHSPRHAHHDHNGHHSPHSSQSGHHSHHHHHGHHHHGHHHHGHHGHHGHDHHDVFMKETCV